MALNSYSDLVAALSDWLDGQAFSARAADFIALAEADFRRQLVMPDMDTTITATGTNPISLPADLDSIRALASIATSSYPQQSLTAVPLAAFYSLPVEAGGSPRQYAIDDGSLYIWPIPAVSISLTLSYRAKLPALSDAVPSNWLLASAPDAYLYGALLQAEFFGWNDERLPLLQAKLQSVIDDLNRAGNRKRFGGPLVMQPPVRECLRR
jgi:hypothetical protein